MWLNHACQKSNFIALTFQNGKSYSLPINIHALHWEYVRSYKALYFFEQWETQHLEQLTRQDLPVFCFILLY